MSGICSAHQGHDPTCPRCTAFPLTEDEKHFYEGMDFAYEAMENNGWHPVEDCVLDGWDALYEAARKVENPPPALAKAVAEIAHMKELNRGFGRKGRAPDAVVVVRLRTDAGLGGVEEPSGNRNRAPLPREPGTPVPER